jgi:hypothetical protein
MDELPEYVLPHERRKQKSDLAVAFSFESLAETVGFEPTIRV